MTINLTPIFQALISLLAALITLRLIPWLKSKTTTEQWEQIRAAVRVAVFAAEAAYGAGHGAEKLDFAMKWLAERDIFVDIQEINAVVEEEYNWLRGAREKAKRAGEPPDEGEWE